MAAPGQSALTLQRRIWRHEAAIKKKERHRAASNQTMARMLRIIDALVLVDDKVALEE